MPARLPLGSTTRVLRPAPNVLGFYDGRIDGARAWSDGPNWLDDGAYSLGVCSFALIDGDEALVYDTHISLPHARLIRAELESMGAKSIRVVLSHWHDDHIAGNEVFADCEIIANSLTASLLEKNRAALAKAEPPIDPLVMPNRLFDDRLDLTVGSIRVELHRADIHSEDGTVLLLPGQGLLFAGDTLEDSITYVAEPTRLNQHLKGLERLSKLAFDRILPNHGAEDIIAGGGYGRDFIDATRTYVEKLLECPRRPDLAALDLRQFAAEEFASGAVRYFAPYEAVHRENVERVLKSSS